MQRFQIHNTAEWLPLQGDETIMFPAGSQGRTIKVDFNTTHHTAVWALDPDDTPFLVGASQGMFRCEIAARTDLTLYTQTEGVVYYQTRVRDQTVAQLHLEKFTNIDPRPETSPEFQAMQRMQRANALRRDAEMEAERAERRKYLDEIATATAQLRKDREGIQPETPVAKETEATEEAKAVEPAGKDA